MFSYIKKIYFYLNGLVQLGPRALTLPRVFLAPGSRINIASNSKLSLGGKLWFGVQQMEHGQYLYQEKALLNLAQGSTFETKANTTIGAGSTIWLYPNAKLSIGKRSYINMNAKIFVRSEVRIGDECAIGFGVNFFDDDFHPVVKLENAGEYFPSKPSPIIIEDHVWIGSGCTILKGVKIGRGSVIAAGSLVNKDIPPNTLVGGTTAKVLKEETTWIL